MALVNSDLFLVQDAVTKTNYKVSFENFLDAIDDNANLDAYVALTGDDMTGDLTLGVDKIVLDASSGAATFGTDKIKLNSFGSIELWRATENDADKLQSWHSNITGVKAEQIRFNAGGSAAFEGDITANSFAGDGSALTNLPIAPGLWVEDANNLSPITAGRSLTSVADITASGDITANSFSGDGSALTNLPIAPGLWVETANNLSPITAGRNLTAVTDITASGDITANAFAGDGSALTNLPIPPEIESIDGGVYA